MKNKILFAFASLFLVGCAQNNGLDIVKNAIDLTPSNEISKIQGRENLPQPQPQDVVPSKKGNSVNSVFIPYDSGVDGKGKHNGEITAGELNGIDKSLEQAVADLEDAAGKVKNSEEGRTGEGCGIYRLFIPGCGAGENAG